jgi:hypothetical protein
VAASSVQQPTKDSLAELAVIENRPENWTTARSLGELSSSWTMSR